MVGGVRAGGVADRGRGIGDLRWHVEYRIAGVGTAAFGDRRLELAHGDVGRLDVWLHGFEQRREIERRAVGGGGVRTGEMLPQVRMEQQVAVDQHGDAVGVRAVGRIAMVLHNRFGYGLLVVEIDPGHRRGLVRFRDGSGGLHMPHDQPSAADEHRHDDQHDDERPDGRMRCRRPVMPFSPDVPHRTLLAHLVLMVLSLTPVSYCPVSGHDTRGRISHTTQAQTCDTRGKPAYAITLRRHLSYYVNDDIIMSR